jgi:hypothetical protein
LEYDVRITRSSRSLVLPFFLAGGMAIGNGFVNFQKLAGIKADLAAGIRPTDEALLQLGISFAGTGLILGILLMAVLWIAFTKTTRPTSNY